MKKTTENSPEFLKLMREWKALEDKTIASANAMMKKSDNPLIRMTMDMIRHDSEKHKVVQQMIIDNITKESIHLSPEELDSLGDVLNRHMELEAGSVALADQALKGSELFITNYLLSYLIADEMKHHSLLSKLSDQLKMASVSTSASSRYRESLDRAPSSIERSHTAHKM